MDWPNCAVRQSGGPQSAWTRLTLPTRFGSERVGLEIVVRALTQFQPQRPVAVDSCKANEQSLLVRCRCCLRSESVVLSLEEIFLNRDHALLIAYRARKFLRVSPERYVVGITYDAAYDSRRFRAAR